MSTEAITRSESSGTGGRAGDQGAMEDAKATAKEAAATAKEEAANVARTVKDQVMTIASDVKSEVRSQSEDRTKQAASKLNTLSDQIDALMSGRPQEAGPLPDYLREGQAKVQAFAQRLEQRGPQGVLDDAVAFGRRRPGAFLVVAAGLGFAVGRLVRAGAFESNGSNGTSSFSGTSRIGTPSATSQSGLSQSGSSSTGSSTGTGMGTGTTTPGSSTGSISSSPSGSPSLSRESTGGGTL